MKGHAAHQQMPRMMARLALLALLCLVLSLALPGPALTAPLSQVTGCTTTVSGNITVDTTWTSAQSPVCLSTTVYVQGGVTLTIEAGVTVRGYFRTSLEVLGTLNASGTAQQPVVFTSVLDSDAGEWIGLVLDGYPSGSTGTLQHVVVRNAGASRYGQNQGVTITRGAVATITNSLITNNLGHGLQVDDGSLVTFSGNTVQNNSAYALVTPVGNAGLLSDNTFSGNGYDRVLISASSANELTESAIWRKNNGSGVYELGKPILVGKAAVLTIEPGVSVLGRSGVALEVQGDLNAVGTTAEAITFTSALDSGPGQWTGLVFDGYYGGGTGMLDNVELRYGGGAFYGQNHGMLLERGAQVSITNSRLSDHLGYGMRVDDSSRATFTNNVVENNTAYPLLVPVGNVAQLSGNTFSGNRPDRVLVFASSANTLNDNATWHKDNGSGVYELAKAITVGQSAVLTLEPGITLMARRGVSLEVFGELIAAGAADQPITFTSAIDNGPGQWVGLVFDGNYNAGKGTLDYVIVQYGGAVYYGSNHSILVERGALVTVTNSQILNSLGYGLRVSGTVGLTFRNNTVSGSALAPLWVLPENLSGIQDNVFVDNGVNQIRSGNNPLPLEALAQFSNTNQVDAYEIAGDIRVGPRARLTVDPGVTVLARNGYGIDIAGSLEALGTEDQPVRFSSAAASPVRGAWAGLRFEGAQNRLAQGRLSHATIEYGGTSRYGVSSNVYTRYADVRLEHSLVRESLGHGLYIGQGSQTSSITFSDIINNGQYAVFNAMPSTGFLAINNWWGASSGPTTTSGCNVGGTGSMISDTVIFRPFISTYGVTPDPLSPRDMAFAEVKPNRWYVPADGTSRAWLEISVRDGAGNPVASQPVRLETSLGSFTNANLMTNAEGIAYTYMFSTSVGTATVTAGPGGLQGVCSRYFQPAITQVNFTAEPEVELFPDQQAPYMNSSIEVTPQPLTQGVPSKILLHFTNPYSQPVAVNGTLGYVQYGIGLAFGPIHEMVNWVIPANQQATYEINWTPPISGHFCLEFLYWFEAPQTVNKNGQAILMMAKKNGRSQKNMDAKPAPLMKKGAKDAAKKGQKAINMMGDAQWTLSAVKDRAGIPGGFVQDQMVGNILDFNFDVWGAASCALAGGENCGGWKGPRLKLPGGGYGSLTKDPPSQDYRQIAPADAIAFPALQPGAGMPAARAAAINQLVEAALRLEVNLMATVVTIDRYAGAADAGDQFWTSQQASAFIYYRDQTALAAIEVADRLDAVLQQLRSEGMEEFYVSADDYRAYQNRLKTSGFNAEELAAAELVGLDDETIEKIRQRRIQNDPEAVSGDVFTRLESMAADLRAFGNTLMHPVFSGQTVSAGVSPSQASEAPASLALIQPLTNTFQAGNPLAQTATMTLKVIPINLPADWTVTLDQYSVTLEPGQQATVTITTTPGSVVVQGTRPRVVVEGYINDQLIGGVVQDMVIPEWVAFNLPNSHTIYLPVLRR